MNILIAEDEPIIRMDIRRMLEELGHRVVAECRDGDSTIRLTVKHEPDLVLMDIKMPGKDGLVATRYITRKKLAPVVLLTSYSDSETIAEAMESGAVGYLVKPVDKEKLGPALKVARQKFLDLRKLSTEIDGLMLARNDRTVVTRTKIMLQQTMGFSEAEAFNAIRKLSMHQRRKMGQVARDLLKINQSRKMLEQYFHANSRIMNNNEE